MILLLGGKRYSPGVQRLRRLVVGLVNIG